ncbi:MAG: acyltransferase domain-containing protein, partial [Proteobacteria bacterium]|nr:acyltransferase domain-containing protein [Pseudomonadota bacterium]
MSRYDIAIIGMGCVFPKANDVGQYWRNVESGESFFEPMPDRLWHMRNFYSEDRKRTDKSYTMVGSFIDPVENFPFLEFKLPPNTMKGSDPAQIATLESVRQALADAGVAPRSEQLHDAVTIIGASGVDQFAHSTVALKRHNYLRVLRPLLEERGASKATLDRLAVEFEAELARRGHVWHPAIAAVGAITPSLSNRVAQVFGVRGFNMTVDGACASSFVALNVACHTLMAGDARLAVVGGSDLGTNPAIYAGFSAVDGLSKRGTSNPFDQSADGLVIGEGVGVVILKRLEDALADGDRVRAVISGIGTSSDGAGQAIYAPSVEGRAEALTAALEVAGISSHEVQFLEAHATSTVVGDANEYDAIATVYAPGRDPRDPLILGSVKGQIGHLKAAAGMAGLIKTVLSMEHATFPHMPRYEKLTPHATKASGALVVPTRLAPWQPRPSGMRVAAVTSSGFGGVNYHVILEQGGVHRAPPARPIVPREVAVVGIACRVAGADTPEKFWANLEQGRDLFVPVDPKELGWEEHYDAGPEGERITTRMVSRVDDYKFNLLRHKIFPTAVSQIAPTQLLAVDLADRLLTDAGFDLPTRKNVGASLGAMHDDNFPKIFMPMITEEYADGVLACPSAKTIDRAALAECIDAAAAKIKAFGPPPTEHTLPGWMTNVIAGRVANRLNLCGPNFTVDTACSSGIAALLPAMYELMFGRVDSMIAGGLNQQLSDAFTCGVCALGAVAEKEAKPYDEDGKGFLIGEGGVFFLLRRLADAKRDGDVIHAVIRAVGGSSEADSKSMVAPTEEAVRRAIRETVARAGVRPEEIILSDTHGSANQASDVVEARALAAELRPNGGPEPLRILATKSHLGHLYGGSGASSTLTTILSLKAHKAPLIRKLRKVRPEIAAIADKVRPVAATEPLPPGASVGGVNSLGLGGANYFAVIASPEHGDGASRAAPEGARLVPASRGESVRAGDPGYDDLFLCLAGDDRALAGALGRALDQDPIPRVITEGAEITSRLAVTFDSQKALRAKLGAAIKMLAAGGALKPLESQGVFAAPASEEGSDKLAFCFPGQGTHYVGMGRVFYDRVPVFRDVVDGVHDLAKKAFDFDLKGHIYGDENDEGIQQRLGTLVGAQTALFAIELAVARMLIEQEGIRPDVMIGHSFGEISALTVAGVWELETAYEVVKARIRAAEIVKTSGGPDLGMMSLICADGQRDAILALVGDRVQLTNINAPGRFVLSGEKDAVKRCVSAAESFGVEARLLPIGAAFHSRFMEPARIPFRDALRKLPCSPPRIPILSTITGEYVSPEGFTSDTIAEHLSGQLVTRLDLPREIGRLHGEGFRHFLEVGPGWSLTKMVDAILEGKPHRMAPTLHPKVGDEETFRRARAFLTALGHTRSAAERHDVPGVFSADFVEYMEANEPAIIALLDEAHRRFLDSARSRHVPKAAKRRGTPGTSGTGGKAASIPSTPSTGSTDASVWIERLKDKLVKTTGYPPEMLEVNLDLEADLGVDSVQRAEIWVSLTTEHGLDPSVRPTGARTIAQLAESLA